MQIETQRYIDKGQKVLKLANTNAGFASLDISINGAKGHMFGKSIDPPSIHFKNSRLESVSTKITTIQDFVMLFDIMKDSDFKQMYDATNNRLYQIFADLDQSITDCGLRRTNGLPMLANWASRYKDWMEHYLDDVSPPVWHWVSATVSDLERKLNSATAPATIDGETLDAIAIETHRRELEWIKNIPEFQQSSTLTSVSHGVLPYCPRGQMLAQGGHSPLYQLAFGVQQDKAHNRISNHHQQQVPDPPVGCSYYPPFASFTTSVGFLIELLNVSIFNHAMVADNDLEMTNRGANQHESRFICYVCFRRRAALSVYHRSVPYRHGQQCQQSNKHILVANYINHNPGVLHESCSINDYRCSQLGCYKLYGSVCISHSPQCVITRLT